jgi:hypothetical protein
MFYAGFSAVLFAAVLAIVPLAAGGLSQAIAAGHLSVVSIFFLGGVQLICAGVLGEYIGRIYDQVRQRPLSLVNHVYRAQALPAREEERSEVQFAA